MSSEEPFRDWRFLTNHTQVLLAIARDPDVRLRDVAEMVGITERAAQRIVRERSESGYDKRERIGLRNRYRVNREIEMRHRQQIGHEIGDLLDLLKLDEG